MTRMDEAAKRRLVGAAVLVALAVIFVPMLVEQGDEGIGEPILIPDAPYLDDGSDPNASWGRSTSSIDQPLPEPDDLTMPLPTPEPPPSALDGQIDAGPAAGLDAGRDAQPARTESRSAAPASLGQGRASASSAPTSTTRTDQGRSAGAGRAPAGPKPVPSGTTAWVIQVASLASPEAARQLQDELRTKGYPAFVEQADVRGRRYYRVRIGPEVERGRADQLAEQLAADTGGQPLVQRYP
ncbi:SPOR domain-containing protein [Halochromatium sp.]